MTFTNKTLAHAAILLFSLAVTASLFSACENAESAAELAPEIKKQVVGLDGGTVTVENGELKGTTVVIPPGALSEDVTITVQKGRDIVVEGGSRTSLAVKLGPEGQTFALPVTVTFAYDVNALPTELQDKHVVLKRSDESGEISTFGSDVARTGEPAGFVSVEVVSFSTLQSQTLDIKPLDGTYNTVAFGTSVEVITDGGTGNKTASVLGITTATLNITIDQGSLTYVEDRQEMGLSIPVASGTSGLQPMLPSQLNARRIQESGSSSTTLLGGGRLAVEDAKGAVSADRSTLAFTGYGGETATVYLGFREGEGLGNSILSGEYSIRGLGLEFNSERPSVGVNDFVFVAKADGSGELSISGSRGNSSLLSLPYGGESTLDETPVDLPLSMSYTVSPDGSLEVVADGLHMRGFVHPDGEAFAFLLEEPSPESVSAETLRGLFVGIRKSSTAPAGRYNFVEMQVLLKTAWVGVNSTEGVAELPGSKLSKTTNRFGLSYSGTDGDATIVGWAPQDVNWGEEALSESGDFALFQNLSANRLVIAVQEDSPVEVAP